MNNIFDKAAVEAKVGSLQRRGLIRSGPSLDSLVLLTGCDLSTHSGVDAALWSMLRFNDRIQALHFNPNRLAATYPESAITKHCRFNAYYEG